MPAFHRAGFNHLQISILCWTFLHLVTLAALIEETGVHFCSEIWGEFLCGYVGGFGTHVTALATINSLEQPAQPLGTG
jgi:hypothetical protein